ncbi:MAG: ferritin-like domain-containing protein [Kofleriaceae bacterium]
MYRLRRTSGEPLSLTKEHVAIAEPRRHVRWELDVAEYQPDALDRAGALWADRARQELISLAHVTELAGKLQALGAPLDWSGALARVIADEVRHADLCLRLCDALGRPAEPEIDPRELRLVGGAGRSEVRNAIVAALCIGETISGRALRRTSRAANVPLARDVLAAILVDEVFHGELGWELAALLMRRDGPAFDDEKAALVSDLPELFLHYAKVCGATREPAWARGEAEVEPGPNFGELTEAGYARAYFDAMETDVVPGLVAIGLPEAELAYANVLASLG